MDTSAPAAMYMYDPPPQQQQQQQQQQACLLDGHVRGISQSQLEFWVKLAHIFDEECPQLSAYLDQPQEVRDQTMPPGVSEHQILVLNMLANNAHVCLSYPKTEHAHHYVRALDCIPLPDPDPLMHTDAHHLCSKHCVTSFSLLKTRLVYLDYTLNGEATPEGLPMRLHLAIDMFEAWAGRPPLRVFEYVTDGAAQEMKLKLQPRYIGSVKDMMLHLDAERAHAEFYHQQMKHHLHCYFCFPSMLSVVAHAIQTGYAVNVSHIPKNMRGLLDQNPALQEVPGLFERQATCVRALLDADGSGTPADQGNVRSRYNQIMSQRWQEAGEDLRQFDYALQADFVYFNERFYQDSATAVAMDVMEPPSSI